MMSPVSLHGTLHCSSAEEAELVAALLPAHCALTRVEPGCLHFDVTRSEHDPLVWTVSERFVDAAAFYAHQARTQASEWGVKTAGIRRSYDVEGLEG